MDDAIRSLVDLGPESLMARFDVKTANRNIPIHPVFTLRTFLGGPCMFYLLACGLAIYFKMHMQPSGF